MGLARACGLILEQEPYSSNSLIPIIEDPVTWFSTDSITHKCYQLSTFFFFHCKSQNFKAVAFYNLALVLDQDTYIWTKTVFVYRCREGQGQYKE